MRIQKCNTIQNQNFGKAIMIKTRNPEVLEKLAEAKLWEVGCKYTTIGGGRDERGFFSGLLTNGLDKELVESASLATWRSISQKYKGAPLNTHIYALQILTDVVNKAKVKTVKTWDALLKLPMLKGLREIEAEEAAKAAA